MSRTCEFLPAMRRCDKEGAYLLEMRCDCGREHTGFVCETCAVDVRGRGAVCRMCLGVLTLIEIRTAVSA